KAAMSEIFQKRVYQKKNLWVEAIVNRGFRLSSELRIPEGIIVRTARGGQDVLRAILTDLKQYSFSGYIKVVLRKENLSSTGYLVIEAGAPTMSIYQFEKTEPREINRIYAGDKSMRFIWEDSADRQSLIELHSRVPKEEFDRRFPDARLQDMEEIQARMAKPVPEPATEAKADKKPSAKKTERTLASEDKRASEKDPILAEIKEMRRQGYVVDKLEEMYTVNRTGAKKELARYQERIEQLKKLEKLLENMPQVGFEDEINAMKERLNDPSQLESINNEVDELKEKMKRQIERTKVAEKRIEDDLIKKKRDEKVGDLYELILQYQRGQTPTKESSACEKCGGALDESGACPKCAGTREGRPAPTALQEGQSFDSFVVGPSNKFAHAAAVAVAQAPDKAYNPLFLFGKSGLGKTHLLNSIARQILAANPGSEVALVSAEKFAEDLEQAMKKEDVHGFRNGLRGKKALLIDDFQFLAGKEMTQGELLYILEDTKREGGQIVIASDRLPKEIPRLSDQLAAKIQGGLIADIQPPNDQTRMEILKRKVRETGKEVPEPVLKYIAESGQNNVRELEAALNRLIAFATVMKVDIDLQLAREVLMPTLGAQGAEKEGMPDVDVEPGHSYLIEEERPVGSNKIFADKVQQGFKGIEITRMNPKQVRQEFGAKGEILWLTDKDSKTEKTVAPSLEMIVHTIESFMSPGEKCVLLVDGLQYLVSNTSFEGVLRFIRRLIDDFSESSSIMMISVSPGTLTTQELSILERELETIKLG
ncbi:MAG TPA: DnaA/Hda family protein, partial [Thermoplasmata archaeon]|nr:DnaA/Hda family protein [Thermoplasmata archaeon]